MSTKEKKDKKKASNKIGIIGRRLISIILPIAAAIISYFVMFILEYPFKEKATDFYIASITMVASSVGLLLSAFVFLNDSLKKRAEADKTLKRIINVAIKSKYTELIFISIASIICIVLCVAFNASNYIKKHLFLGIVPFALAVGVVVNNIVFSAFNISTNEIIQDAAQKCVKKEHKHLLSLVKKYRMDQVQELINQEENESKKEINRCIYKKNEVWVDFFIDDLKGVECDAINSLCIAASDDPFHLTFLRLLKTDNYTYNSKKYYDLSWFTKYVQQIDTIIKTISANNVNRSASDDEERIKEDFKWLYSDKKEYTDPQKITVDKQDSARLLDLILYALIVFESENRLIVNEIKKRPSKKHDILKDLVFIEEKRTDLEAYGRSYLYGKKASSAEEEQRAQKLVQEKYLQLSKWFNNQDAATQIKLINILKEGIDKLIDELFYTYQHLMRYQEALNIYGEKKDVPFTIYRLAQTTLQILLDRFCGFVRMVKLNLGGAFFNKSWLNRSDISGGSFVNSNFKYTRFENGTLKDCNFSASTFQYAELPYSNLSNCNFNYANFKGSNCKNANFSNSLMDDVLFRNYRDIPFKPELKKSEGRGLVALIKSYNDGSYSTIKTDWIKTISESSKNNNSKKKDEIEKAVIDQIKELQSKIEEAALEKTRDKQNKGNVNNLNKVESLIFKDDQDPDMIVTRYFKNHNNSNKNTITIAEKGEPADLTSATINNVVLRSVDFGDVCLLGASFVDSTMTDSVIGNEKCPGINFTGANLSKSVFYNVDLSESVFYNANMYRASFLNTQLSCGSLERASMIKAFITGGIGDKFLLYALSYGWDKEVPRNLTEWSSDWGKAKLKATILVQSVILNTCMDQANFDEVNLKESVLYNSLFRWSSFVHSDLSFALIEFCSFYQSNLQDVQLPRTKMLGCDLTNARIDNALLINTEITMSAFIKTAIKNSTFSRVVFKNCFFNDALFVDNTMVDVEFDGCVFLSLPINTKVDSKNPLLDSVFNNCKFYGVEENISRQIKGVGNEF